MIRWRICCGQTFVKDFFFASWAFFLTWFFFCLKAWPLTLDSKQIKYMCKLLQTKRLKLFYNFMLYKMTKYQWNQSIVSSSFCSFWFFSCCLCLPAVHQQWLDCNKSMPELSDVRSMKLGDWTVWVRTQVRRYYPTTARDTQYTCWICRHILGLNTETVFVESILGECGSDIIQKQVISS